MTEMSGWDLLPAFLGGCAAVFWFGVLLALGVHAGRVWGAAWLGPIKAETHSTTDENITVNLPRVIPVEIVESVFEASDGGSKSG